MLVSDDSATPNTSVALIFDPHDISLVADQVTVTSTGEDIGWDRYEQTGIVSRIQSAAPAGLSPRGEAG